MLEQKLMEQITKLKGEKEGKTIMITIIIKNNHDNNKREA